MKTIEITRDALGTLIADEAKWYAKATELEAANARLRDEIQGVVKDVEELREALTQAVTAKNAKERAAARKRANEALVRTVTCPF